MGGIAFAVALVCAVGIVCYLFLAYLPAIVAWMAKGILLKVRKGR